MSVEPSTASGLFSLAADKLQRGEYPKAIESFRKSITLQERWNSYQGLGSALFRTKQFTEAIEAFRKSIYLKEHWNSYQGLGSALLRTNQFQEAIEAFNKSLALNEHWNSYQSLGTALCKTKRFEEAIEAFRKSLALKEHWSSYQILGWSLVNTSQFIEAIESFRKSITLRENWNSYQGLGWALFNTNHYPEAIDSFKHSLTLINQNSTKEITFMHLKIAQMYDKLHNKSDSIYHWEKYFSYIEPVTFQDPFLGNGGIYEQISGKQIKELKDTFKGNGFDFHPSYENDNSHYLNSWKYLIYLHIHKCGGTSFERPLNMLKEQLKELHSRHPGLDKDYLYLNTGKQLTDGIEVSNLKRIISPKSFTVLTSAFLALHGVKWGKLHDQIRGSFNACPKIITTIREPRERLLSHIKHKASQYCNSMEELISLIEKERSVFDNLMHRHIFDYSLDEANPTSYGKNEDYRVKSLKDIYFIDIYDSVTISKVKSDFLSASLLPNIIQSSRFKDSNDRLPSKLSHDEIKMAYKLCVNKGFLEKDESIDYRLLKDRTKKKLNLASLHDNERRRIHPLTFIVNKELKSSIIPTQKLLNEPMQILRGLNT